MRIVTGLLCVLLGAPLLLYTYAFASMIDPALSDAEWRSVLLRKMFWQHDFVLGTYPALGLIFGGIWLIWSGVARLIRDLVRSGGARLLGAPDTSP